MHTKRFSYLKPLKIDLYIFQEIISTFLGSCLFIVFILLMFQALRLAEFFIVHGAPALILGKMTFFLSVSFLPTALPFSFLISVLVGFGRMSADSEIVAMKANGMSLLRLTYSAFLLSFVVAALSIGLNNDWVPWSVMAFKKTQIKLGNTKVVTAIKEGTFTEGFFDLLIFTDKVDTRTNRLHRVFIYDEREAKNPLTYVANDAEILPVKSSSELGASIILRLNNGSLHHNNLETNTYEKIDFESYNLYLKIDEGSDATILKPHMIPQGDLIDKIKNHEKTTYLGREFRGEYWRRYATALSPIVFVLIGIGFGTVRQRTAKAGAIMIGFVILLTYWTLQTAGTTAVLQGRMTPIIAMQMPNVVLLIIGIFAFRRAAW